MFSRNSLNVFYCISGLVVLSILFIVFTYNSGYGYDALEYLNIGRGMRFGQRLYDYVPSKSPLFYGYVSCWYYIFNEINHLQLSIILTIQFIVLGLTAYYTTINFYTKRIGLISAVLILISFFLTEMNFMEPESILLTLVIPAYGMLLAFFKKDNSISLIILCGILLGLACMIKATALFVLLAFVLIILFIFPGKTLIERFKCAVVLGTSFFSVLLCFYIYFLIRHHGYDFYFWTFIYPLKYYPGDSFYLKKSLIKLSPLLVLTAAGIIVSLFNYRKYTPTQKQIIISSLTVGCILAISLFKTQASHYFFPVLYFLLLPACFWLSSLKFNHIKYLIPAAIFSSVCFLVSVYFYRPDALARFSRLYDYTLESNLKKELKKLNIDFHAKGIILDDERLLNQSLNPQYCTAIISQDAQDGYYLAHHPESLLKPVAGKTATYVLFNIKNWPGKNPSFATSQNYHTFIQLQALLKRNYRPVPLKTYSSTILWLPIN